MGCTNTEKENQLLENKSQADKRLEIKVPNLCPAFEKWWNANQTHRNPASQILAKEAFQAGWEAREKVRPGKRYDIYPAGPYGELRDW